MRTLCGFPGEADPRQQEQDNESPSRMTDNADAELSAQNGWEAAAIECFQGRGLCTTSESCCLHELSKREDPSPKTMRWQERNGSYKTAFRVIEGKKISNYASRIHIIQNPTITPLSAALTTSIIIQVF
jgi:hypothetical protein